MSCQRIYCRFSWLRFASVAAVCSLAMLASEVSAQCESCGTDSAYLGAGEVVSGGGVTCEDGSCGDANVACADGSCRSGSRGGAGRGGLRNLLGKGGCALCGCKGDGTHCGMPAPSYPVPFATPRNVTHTTFTYPPMMPHHSLPHYAGVYSFRHGPGLSRTNVYWRQTKGINAFLYLKHMFELPR